MDKATRTITVQAYINDGPGRFMGYEPGDKLYPVELALTFTILEGGRTFDSLAHEALDLAWAVGNRVQVDSLGQEWPSFVRSLSVGDVLTIRTFDGGPVLAWGVDRFGFVALGQVKDQVSVRGGEHERQAWALAVSMSELGREHQHPFGAPARSREEAGLK